MFIYRIYFFKFRFTTETISETVEYPTEMLLHPRSVERRIYLYIYTQSLKKLKNIKLYTKVQSVQRHKSRGKSIGY